MLFHAQYSLLFLSLVSFINLISSESFHWQLSALCPCINNFKNVPIIALTAVGALMTLTDFTLSNSRRFYSSMGNRLAVKGLTTSKTMPPLSTFLFLVSFCFQLLGFYTQLLKLRS